MLRRSVLLGVATTIALMIGLVVAFSIASASPAQQEARGPFYSYFQIQAVESGTTSIVIEYVDTSGAIVDTDSITLTQGDSQIFYQSLNNNLGTNFQGSAVVSSDKRVAVFSSATDFYGYSGQSGTEGVQEGSTEALLPLIMRHYSAGWYTRFAVQNTSSSEDAHVTIRYYADTVMNGVPVGESIYTDTHTIPPLASYYVDQSAMTDVQLPSGFKGSVKITSSDQPVVAETLQWQSGNSRLQSYNGIAPSAAAQRWYVPLNMNNFSASWYTYIQVQNVDVSVPANITITYSTSPATVFTDTVQASQTYYAVLAGLPDKWTGSAVVEADRGVVVIVGEAQNHPGKSYASTLHNAFTDADSATEFSVPIAMKKFSADWYTHLVIQTLDTSQTNPITITYSDSTVFNDTLDAAKPSGIYYTALDPNLPDGFLGAATVTSDYPVVIIIGSNSASPAKVKGDWASRFRAIPMSP